MCSEAHQRDPRNANVLRDRAEAYILNQDYEKGDTVFSMNATQLIPCLCPVMMSWAYRNHRHSFHLRTAHAVSEDFYW